MNTIGGYISEPIVIIIYVHTYLYIIHTVAYVSVHTYIIHTVAVCVSTNTYIKHRPIKYRLHIVYCTYTCVLGYVRACVCISA